MRDTINLLRNLCFAISLLLGTSVWNDVVSQSFETINTDVQSFIKTNDIEVKVYPNPTSDFVVVSTNKVLEGRFKLNNIFGKTLMEGEINDEKEKINLLEFRTGIYIITLYDESGQKLATRKIIKN